MACSRDTSESAPLTGEVHAECHHGSRYHQLEHIKQGIWLGYESEDDNARNYITFITSRAVGLPNQAQFAAAVAVYGTGRLCLLKRMAGLLPADPKPYPTQSRSALWWGNEVAAGVESLHGDQADSHCHWRCSCCMLAMWKESLFKCGIFEIFFTEKATAK